MQITPPTGATAPDRPDMAALRAQAQELEAVFLAEMLKHAGLDAEDGAFGGGTGEAQFASFLRQEQAQVMARAGGIGLTESLLRAMIADGEKT